jgi:hypothetical protein
MKCPYCDFEGRRMDVHVHLAGEHGGQIGTREHEVLDVTYYVVRCPICGAEHEEMMRKTRKDPEFITKFEHQIRLVAFDMLLYHLQGEHGVGTEQQDT